MKNEYLRHTVATIQYRFQQSIKEMEDAFGDFNLGKGSRSPKEIINHMYQVLHYTRFFIEGDRSKDEIPEKLSLTYEIERFNDELKALDRSLTHRALEMSYTKRLLQGPLADMLTHIGQLAMLQRMNGEPIEKEDFAAATIRTGLV
ncbi:MAG: hypothetical protein R2828_19080 [Saprospiraceae bacterium]